MLHDENLSSSHREPTGVSARAGTSVQPGTLPATHLARRSIAAPGKFEMKCSACAPQIRATSWLTGEQFCLELRGCCFYTPAHCGIGFHRPCIDDLRIPR